MTTYYYGDTLYHHGIKGQKWGIRKYQNEDGSLTPAGREHYGYGRARSNMQSAKAKYKADKKAYSKAFDRATGAGQYIRGLTKKGRAENEKRYAELVKTAKKASDSEAAYKSAKKEYKNSDEYKARQEKIKKAVKVGAAVAGTALAVYGAYKVSQAIKDKAYYKAYESGKNFADEMYKHNGVRGWTTYKDGTITLQNHFGRSMGTYSTKEQDAGYTAPKVAKIVNDAAWDQYMKDMKEVRNDADNASKNVVSATKYLYKNRKRR